MEKRHILIVGAKGAGKSALVQKLAALAGRPLGGFVTRAAETAADGSRSFHIYPAGDPDPVPAPENCIGKSDGKTRTCYPGAFVSPGLEYLAAGSGRLIVMDEIGDMEAGVPAFCDAVLARLDGDEPVLAAVKDRPDCPFLAEVLRHPRAAVYRVTETNRDELFEAILKSEEMRKIRLW